MFLYKLKWKLSSREEKRREEENLELKRSRNHSFVFSAKNTVYPKRKKVLFCFLTPNPTEPKFELFLFLYSILNTASFLQRRRLKVQTHSNNQTGKNSFEWFINTALIHLHPPFSSFSILFWFNFYFQLNYFFCF